MEYWVDRRGYCYITWSFTIAMWCHNGFPQSSNYYLLSSNSYTQHRLKKIMIESPKIRRNYSISRYRDHSRLLDMPFTLLVTSMTRPTALYDSRNFGNDSRRLGFDTYDSRLDSGLETDDSRLDSGLGPWKKQRLETWLETRPVWLGTRLETRQSRLVHSSDHCYFTHSF